MRMKKEMLVSAGLLLAGVGATAQNYFGVTGGYNLTHHHAPDDYYFEYENKSGFNAGIAYEHRFKNSGNNYLFLDASVLYSLEQYSCTQKDKTINLNDMVFASGGDDSGLEMKYLKVPVGVGYNFQLAEKFGLAPKVYGILDVDVHKHPGAKDNKYCTDPYFAFGGGANLNIGERFQIGMGYDWNLARYISPRYLESKNWTGNFHTNLTYYLFSK